MPKYSENDIETIKSRLRLSDVIGNYVRLTRQGSTQDYKACCPFHHEKTPSFLVHDDKGFYHCFGCGKSGNLFSFVQEMENITFPEAVEMLAKKAGVELKVETAQEKARSDRNKVIQDIYNRITVSYHQILKTTAGAQKAREYLAKRNISDETCDKFMLGYAQVDANWLYPFLKKNNYSDEVLWESGLVSRQYNNQAFFRDRILFPVRDRNGNTIAFSGRDLSGKSPAKYKNSESSSIYSKKETLFGFYESLQAIKTKQEVILCEGNFDVISLHQAGLDYAVASLGTSFTPEQAKLLKRYCKRVYILFDSDDAGQNATIKAMLHCQQNDLECRVIRPLPGAKDPSQMLEEQGAEALAKACLNTDTAFSYLVHLAIKRYDIRQPKGKSSVFKEVKPFLDATSSEIERQGYIKLLSEILKVSEEQILNDYRNQGTDIRPQEKQVNVTKTYNPITISADLNAMLLLINNRSYFDLFRKEIKINQLEDDAAIRLYTVLENASREEIKTDEVVLQMITDEGLRNFVAASFADGLHRPDNVEREIENAADIIRLERLIESRNNIISLIKSTDAEGLKETEFTNMLEAKCDLDRKIEELKKHNTEVISDGR